MAPEGRKSMSRKSRLQLEKKLFNTRYDQDEYMIDTIYGLSSTDDMAAVYRDNVSVGELLDEIIEYKNHLYFYDSDFENLIDEIIKMKGEE